MRELRFRAWHKDSYIELNDLRGNKSIYFGPYDLGFITQSIDRKEVELEQYTGLKDKNGKEIYEGDIVKVDRGLVNGVVSFVKMCDSDVDWYYLGWGVNRESLLEWSDMGQVIGNIHENPELLEQGNAKDRR